MAKRKGRPPKRSPEIEDRIVALIERGNFRATAVKIVGISQGCLGNWIADDPALKARIEAAENHAESKALEKIEAASDWKAAAWFLERKFPERWAQDHRMDYRKLAQKKLMVEIELLQRQIAGNGGPTIPAGEEDFAQLMREKYGSAEKVFESPAGTNGTNGTNSAH